MHGQGVYTWSNGNTYVGEYIKGKKEGYGVFKSPSQGIEYAGEFKNGF